MNINTNIEFIFIREMILLEPACLFDNLFPMVVLLLDVLGDHAKSGFDDLVRF